MSLGAFYEVAALEAGSGPDKRDEVGCVDRSPPLLADSTSLKTRARAAAALPAPSVTLVPSRTVAKVDSIGFVVRR